MNLAPAQQPVRKPPTAAEAPPVRILHLHAGNLYGGVETLLMTLARVRHLCPTMESHFGLCFEGRFSRELASTGVPIHMLGGVRISRPWTVWKARRRLRELLRKERYDAVICHQHWPLVVFGRTARRERRPLVFWAHNFQTGRKWLERLAARITPDLAISTSQAVASTISGTQPDVVSRVLYCPLELADVPKDPGLRERVRLEQETRRDHAVIIQVSRFEPWKGQLLHLDALARLTSTNWVCWMVGGAQDSSTQSHYDDVRRRAEQLGLADRIRFLGQRSDIARLLAGADIFCQPNQGPEPFGIAYVEALWAGLPVITTAMGGALEIVDDSCGLLVERDNPAILAAALDRLIQSPELRKKLGAAGPSRARELCDPAAQMRALEHLIRGTIEGRLP